MFNCAASSLNSWTVEKNGSLLRRSCVSIKQNLTHLLKTLPFLQLLYFSLLCACILDTIIAYEKAKLHPILSLSFHSVTSSTAALMQDKDSDPSGDTKTEISHKPTSARQTNQIPEPD